MSMYAELLFYFTDNTLAKRLPIQSRELKISTSLDSVNILIYTSSLCVYLCLCCVSNKYKIVTVW